MGKRGPFLGSEALAAGEVSRRQLLRGYQAVYRDVYLARDEALTPITRAQAAWLWSGRQATAVGLSAAALHSAKWIDAAAPAELNRASGKGVSGIVINRETLLDDETCRIGEIMLTTPARTAFDLGRRPCRTLAVIDLDALAHATGLQSRDVDALSKRHRGMRGVRQLREVVQSMDGGAESPQETRTRLLLIDAGLPKPQTQIVVADEDGYLFARIDMGWEQWRVGVEYDGEQHWTDPRRRASDIDRLARLDAAGWRIVRVSSDLLRNRPRVLVARVCDALRAAGFPECPVTTRLSLEAVS
jgi:hypothetical protein